MIERVYILATVRRSDLLPAATLVFRTLRVGFPNATVTVQSNGLPPAALAEIATLCHTHHCRFEPDMHPTQHDRWLARLLEVAHEPFWIVDTDTVFFDSMEGAGSGHRLAGEYQPAWLEEYTRTTHVERLHTACLYCDPVAIRDAVREHISRYPAPAPFDVQRVTVLQTYVPTPQGVLFYDTAAGLYHAIGGTRLPAEVVDRFEHLQCATYIDRIGPALVEAPGLAECHARVYADPQNARGLRAAQAAYYATQAP